MLSFGIVLLYILLPLKFLYADKVKYEVVAELFLLLCVDLLGRGGSSRGGSSPQAYGPGPPSAIPQAREPGITRGRAQNIQFVTGSFQRIFKKISQQLHRNILERQRRAIG